MIILKLLQIISSFILPPGIFILLFCIGIYFFRSKKIIFARSIFLLLISLLYLLSTGFIAKLIIYPLECSSFAFDYQKCKAYNSDYLVILGGGLLDSSPDENMDPSLPAEALKRLYYGLFLAKKYNLKVIYSGGSSDNIIVGKSEADTALKFALRYGFKKRNFLLETSSHSTKENAEFTKEKYNPNKIILVTSAYHIKRSKKYFEKYNIEVIAAPTDYKYSYPFKIGFFDFLPNADNLNNSSKAIREYLALIYQYLY